MSPRTGRRPGESGSREAILDAARATFGEVGYDGASIRDIARRAEVDPALIHHFFGTKQGLLTAAVEVDVDHALVVATVLEGDRALVGRRVAQTFFQVWDAPAGRDALLGLIRSAVSNPAAATMLREFLGREILGPVTRALDVDEPERRAALVAAQLVGVAFTRYVLALEPLASMAPAALAADIGPALQRYLVEDLGGSAAPRRVLRRRGARR